MFRENWSNPRFWRWWWRTCLPVETKLLALVLVVPLLLVGGYFASGGVRGPHVASGAVVVRTVQRVVTVKSHGSTSVRRVPVVVSQTVERPSTGFSTVVETRVVTHTGAGHVTTVGSVRTVPLVRLSTVRDSVTNVVTDSRTVTLPPATVTQTQTATRTQTVVQSVTQPPVTSTVTVTVPLITLP